MIEKSWMLKQVLASLVVLVVGGNVSLQTTFEAPKAELIHKGFN